MVALDHQFDELMTSLKGGDSQAWSSLVRLVYDDLRRLARAQLGGAARTLNTTALVHECYFRINEVSKHAIESKSHFYNLASRIMRQVLCDYAREQLAIKRGSGQRKEAIDDIEVGVDDNAADLVEIDQLLRRLEKKNPRLARVFEHRYFGGLNDAECAEAMGASLRTVQRDWNVVRAWLAKHMGES